MAENRGRILIGAARLFRDGGFDAVPVAEVMKTAGLTHGGFYGHFASKDGLIAQTVAHAMSGQGDRTLHGFPAFLDVYLSTGHRDAPTQGCPVAAFAADARRQTREARTAMAQRVRDQIDRLTDALAAEGVPDPRRVAIGGWLAAVGAMILVRSVDDPALSDEMLDQTRRWILSAPAE